MTARDVRRDGLRELWALRDEFLARAIVAPRRGQRKDVARAYAKIADDLTCVLEARRPSTSPKRGYHCMDLLCTRTGPHDAPDECLGTQRAEQLARERAETETCCTVGCSEPAAYEQGCEFTQGWPDGETITLKMRMPLCREHDLAVIGGPKR